MPWIHLPRRWQTQPGRVPLRIEPGSPFASRLVLDWIGTRNRNQNVASSLGKHNGSLVGTSIVDVAAPFGLATSFSAVGSADRINLGSVTSADGLSGFGQSAMTIMARAYLNPYANILSYDPSARFFDKSNAGNAAGGYGVWVADGGTGWSIGAGVDTAAATGAGVFTVPDQKWTTFAFVFLPGTGCVVYVDAVNVGTVLSTFPAFSNVTTNAAIGNWNHTTGRGFNGSIEYLRVFTGQLSDAEIRNLTYAPYQVYTRPRSRVYFDTALPATPTGTIAWTEPGDTWAAAGSTGSGSSIAWTESGDTWAATGTVTPTGTIAWTEAGDSWAATGALSPRGAISWTEPSDSWAVVAVAATGDDGLDPRNSRATADGASYPTRIYCPVCDERTRRYEFRRRWDGVYVCQNCWDPRHPLDFYRPKQDRHPEKMLPIVPEATALTFTPSVSVGVVGSFTYNSSYMVDGMGYTQFAIELIPNATLAIAAGSTIDTPTTVAVQGTGTVRDSSTGRLLSLLTVTTGGKIQITSQIPATANTLLIKGRYQ